MTKIFKKGGTLFILKGRKENQISPKEKPRVQEAKKANKSKKKKKKKKKLAKNYIQWM